MKRGQDPVLSVDPVRALGVLLGLRPPTRSQLDERQKPVRGGSRPLILVAPPQAVRLQQVTRALGEDGPGEDVGEHEFGPLNLLTVAGGHGELVGALGFSGSVRIAAVESKEGESGQRPGAERVVVEPFGKVDRHARMALSPRHPLREASE